ncbi:hypothetical protein QAD02_002801 [Eretmocerus hayati]|uniref:Uncharacterized protein n=1 Tax=Eretmocerus hayati TaxID=131215 RepID=A0ACC2NKB1_9HYME|nr:hypothetical protein QAD02_002801 [Eretmocerus hayati]
MLNVNKFRHNDRFAKKRSINRDQNALAAIAEAKKKKKEISERENQPGPPSQAEINGVSGFLSLCNIVNERRFGLHPVSNVRCEQYNMESREPTGKTDRKLPNINETGILGTIYSGAGCTTLNKNLATANILPVAVSACKRYERVGGPAIEEAAKESCMRAALEERRLVLENLQKLRSEL